MASARLRVDVYGRQVDATVEKKLAERFKVGGFPSIKYLKNRADLGTFSGNRQVSRSSYLAL